MDKKFFLQDCEFLLKFAKSSQQFILAFASRVPCFYEKYSHEDIEDHQYDVYGIILYPIGFEMFGYKDCAIDVDHWGNIVYLGSKIPLRVERVILDVIRDYELCNRVVPADLDLEISETHYQNRGPEKLEDVY